jgi:hypothetical protein
MGSTLTGRTIAAIALHPTSAGFAGSMKMKRRGSLVFGDEIAVLYPTWLAVCQVPWPVEDGLFASLFSADPRPLCCSRSSCPEGNQSREFE